MKNTKNCVFFAFWVCLAGVHAGPSWGRYLAKPDDWFRSERGQVVHENIQSWQDKWLLAQKYRYRLQAVFGRWIAQGAFDNSHIREMRMLARAHRATGRPAYQCVWGLTISGSYPTGGWPQYYPPPKSPAHHQ